MSFWKFSKIENAGKEEIELRIEGDIVDDDDTWIYEWFEVKSTSPNKFRNELKEHKGKDIMLWIDSYGGSVYAAAGIYNALKEHKGKITVKIDGKAMSAASVIAMAGDEVLMSPMAVMMIHNPLCGAYGYASELRKVAEVLDTIKDAIMNAYQLKTGRSREEISKMMDDETYMSAKSAVDEKFADGVMYGDLKEDDVSNFAFSRLAIVNSTDEATRRMIEQLPDIELAKKKLELQLIL